MTTSEIARPPAVSVEGAVAYVEDLDGAYRGDVANPSRIVVVEPDGTSVPWTRGADVTYVTAAWAGSTLLAYTVGEGEHLSVLAFDGSGEARVLSEDGAIGAISPDGVFVVTTEPGPYGQAISLMRVSDGTVLDRLEAFGELGEMYLSYGGDWRDGLVVLPAGRTTSRAAARSGCCCSRSTGMSSWSSASSLSTIPRSATSPTGRISSTTVVFGRGRARPSAETSCMSGWSATRWSCDVRRPRNRPRRPTPPSHAT